MSLGPHLTQNQLIEHLYCSIEGSAAHLTECAECRTRFAAIEQTRESDAKEIVPTNDFFQWQRHVIVERTGQTSASILGSVWVPVALSVALAVSLLVAKAFAPPALESAIQDVEIIDILEPGWFDETYTVMRVAEPRAASPIVDLFSQQPVVE